MYVFLLYSPLNQGLKPRHARACDICLHGFLLYSPLNQGLKLTQGMRPHFFAHVFTLQSIKSRIETGQGQEGKGRKGVFLLYSPLNQGLKLSQSLQAPLYPLSFYSTVH